MRISKFPVVAAFAVLAASCTDDGDNSSGAIDDASETADHDGTSNPDVSGAALPKLSDYGFFEGNLRDFVPAPGVVEFVPISPLWADHAAKGRYLVLPPGEQVTFDGGEDWVYPDGTIIVKNFFFSLDRRDLEGAYRVMETRLLIREAGAWSAHTYAWNEDETDAVLTLAGGRVNVDFIDEEGQPDSIEYLIPNKLQCGDCHKRSDVMRELGINTWQLNYEVEREGVRVNQLQWLADQGVFDAALPDLTALPNMASPADAEAPAADRARAYLHANCSHCHRPGGDGGRSGLSLLFWEEDPARYGVCKGPVAAGNGAGGRAYDIVPGEPENSIMIYRMSTTDPEIRMPELPSRIADDFGVSVISEWIDGMSPEGCEP